MKEKVLLVGSKRSLDRRRGWELWNLLKVFWRSERSGGLERMRVRTVMPVPVGTALHQLYSVPPAGRALGSSGSGGEFEAWSPI